MSRKRKEQPVRNESEMYEVEQILDKRLTINGFMYLIRWKGYPDPSDYTWEPIQHLTEVEDLVKKFNQDCDQRITRQRNKPESKNPNGARRQQPQESEEQESEPQARRHGRRRKLPSEEKSQADRKQTSCNQDEDEDEDEDEEVVSQSKPRRVEPRKAEPKKEKERDKVREKEKENEDKKGRGMEEKTKVQCYWEEQGLELGRVHKHHLENGRLIFSVNLNKGELVYGMVPLRIDQIRAVDEEKLVAYMENWARHHLMEKAYQTTQEYKDFQNFWKSAD